jgi:ubiquinone/menaquinone biosynthesis C-methylase UbiE
VLSPLVFVVKSHKKGETRMTDLVAIKARQQQAWASGDWAMIAWVNVIVGEQLCEAIDLHAGQQVLDVATGSGNTALSAARRWCDVTDIDYVPAQLERGRERAAAERLPVTFCEGDTEQIPFPDASFDVVLSTFGAQFAPDPEQTARELLRVCRPEGKIGLANLTPESFSGAMYQIRGHYSSRSPGLCSPYLWGPQERLQELFGAAVTSLQVTPRTVVFRYRSAQHWLEVWRTYFGPLRQAFARLDTPGQEALAGDLVALVHRMNQSGDETMVVPSAYLEIVATKR